MLIAIVNCTNLDTDTSHVTLPLPTEKTVHNLEGLDSQMLSVPLSRMITENAQVTPAQPAVRAQSLLDPSTVECMLLGLCIL